jgi:hypothetical protein
VGSSMRPALFVAVTAFLLPWSGSAQVPSIFESGSLQAGGHSWRKVLRNQSPSALVAYMVGCNPEGGMTSTHDALIDGGAFVGSGKSIEVQVNAPSTCDASVHAAIFSDDHAEGDPNLVQKLFAYRRGAYQSLGDTIKLLASVYTQHVPIANILEKLDTQRRSNLQKMTAESGGCNMVLFQISNALSKPHVVWRVPPEYQGQKLELPSIEDVMAGDGVSQDEARVILLNKRLEAWKSLLEHHLEPSQ